MSLSVNPQEIYLLVRYISTDYFRVLRDTWTRLVGHVASCLASHGEAPLAWGERVLPGLRDTLEGLNTGYLLLKHGDFTGLGHAWGPRSDFGNQMEYWCAQFLGTRKPAPSARVLVGVREMPNLVTGEQHGEERMFEERSCVWYLVERIPDLNQALQARRPDIAHGERLALGEKCRQIRLYFTPAPDEHSLFPMGFPLPGHRLIDGGA
ncbi:hypothetical protein [Massilia niastensis]|uniref:hypothetical protein n=1 Tax=Massilia niastensis TaxID=544911 RepID=UPI0003651F1E|nr:hypothetical protein [Massilia niastensis]